MHETVRSAGIRHVFPSFRKPFVAALATVMLLGAAAAQATERIRVAIEPWPPYADAELPGQGFLSEITVAAFEAAGYQADVEFIPWARALYDVRQGHRDVLMGLFYSEERETHYRYSDVVYQTNVALVAREGFERGHYESIDDLKSYTIGVGRGFANSPEFDTAVEAGELDVVFAEDHGTHIRMLFADRIDMVAGTVDIILHMAREAGHDTSELMLLEPPLKTHDIHIGVSRAIDDSARIRDAFNEGLAEIRRTGAYDTILEKQQAGD